MGRIKRVFFVLLLLGLCIIADAQNHRKPYFEHYTVREGLKSEHINDICQDKTGFIWIATENGLNKYDGINMVGYTQTRDSTGFNHRKVAAVACDANNNVWVGTLKGLFKYDRKRNLFIKYFESDENTSWKCSYLFGDSKGNLWISRDRKLLFSDKLKPHDEGSYKEITIKDENGKVYEFGSVGDIIELGNHKYIFKDKKRLFVVNIKNSEGYRIETKGIRGNIGALSRISQDKFSIATYFGHYIGSIKDKKFVIEHKFERGDEFRYIPNYVSSSIVDGKGRIWIGSDKGGYIFIPEGDSYDVMRFSHNFNREHSISGNNVSKLFQDEGNVVWLGTKGYGLEKYDEHKIKFEKYNLHEQKEGESHYYNVERVLKDAYGMIWIDSYWYLIMLNEQTGSYFKIEENKIQRRPSGMIERKKGEMWVYGSVLQRVLYEVDDEKNFQLKQIDTYHDSLFGLKNVLESIVDAAFDGEGNLWLGSKKSGLVKLQLKDSENELPVVLGNYIKSGKLKPQKDAISDIEFDKEGNLWLATYWDGIYKFDTKMKRYVKQYIAEEGKENTLKDYGARCLYVDTIGSVWAGTMDGGLNHINYITDKVVGYSEGEGFLSRTISAITEDNEGNLWVSSGGGVSRFSKSNKSVVNYGVDDGLQGYYFAPNCRFKDKDGVIYFGGNKGLNSFNPERINRANDYKPRVALVGLKVNKKKVSPNDGTKILKTTMETTRHIKIKHKQNDFQIGFAALSFSSPEKNLYRYKLEDYDEDWIEVSTQTPWAVYSNLPRGRYTFKVKASNSSYIWSDEVTTLKVRVRPPWWRTYVFYFLVTVSVAFLLFSLVKFREERLRKDREKLQKELDKGRKEIEKQRVRVEKQESELILKNEREKIAKWHNNGLINVSDVISENRNNEEELPRRVINQLVNYVGAQQGAIYLYSNDKEEPYLELKGGFALSAERLEKDKILVGEGLIGTCFKKSEIIRTDNLPKNYSELESGLGKTSLKHSIVFPIQYEDEAVGVIEVLSLEKPEEYKVDFAEAASRNLASALINIQANIKIQNMLVETKQQQEMLVANEEELRQNLEELAATQEESSRREEKLAMELNEYKQKVLGVKG